MKDGGGGGGWWIWFSGRFVTDDTCHRNWISAAVCVLRWWDPVVSGPNGPVQVFLLWKEETSWLQCCQVVKISSWNIGGTVKKKRTFLPEIFRVESAGCGREWIFGGENGGEVMFLWNEEAWKWVCCDVWRMRRCHFWSAPSLIYFGVRSADGSHWRTAWETFHELNVPGCSSNVGFGERVNVPGDS